MRKPGRTVVFVGAGATRPFGLPLTAEILPALMRRLARGTLFGRTAVDRRAARRLRDRLLALAPGLHGAGVEPPLITDLLSVIDHMLTIGHAVRPGLGPHELDELRSLLERGVAEVLAAPPRKARRNRALLERFTDWTLGLAETGLTLISTNYDVVVDRGLYGRLDRSRLPQEVDFGIDWYALRTGRHHPRPARPRLRLLKLHGSLDWLRCPLCEHLYIEPAETVFRASHARRAACACGYRRLRHVIVAPSSVRDVRDGQLLAIWQAAVDALRVAERWIVIGYSMPPEDVAIRSMFIRALGGRRRPPQVVVVQRQDRNGVRDRYRLFVPSLQFVAGGLESLMRG